MVACESFPDGPPMRGNYPIYEHFKSGQRRSKGQASTCQSQALNRNSAALGVGSYASTQIRHCQSKVINSSQSRGLLARFKALPTTNIELAYRDATSSHSLHGALFMVGRRTFWTRWGRSAISHQVGYGLPLVDPELSRSLKTLNCNGAIAKSQPS